MKIGLPFFFLSFLALLTPKVQAQSGIGSTSSCQAFYTSNEDPGNPMLINFMDQSTGNITSWMWSFGDGAYSDLQNPSHLFSSPGLYTVCLTIVNPDTSNYCWDQFCDTIYVNIIHDCKADFSVILDSMNTEPNTFIFSDQSTGNTNSWLWLFGDSSLSIDQNPVHRFTNSGEFNVCLLIAETDSTGIHCYDSTCRDLITPAYFDLGGHLFAGDFPINNPLSTGDTGLVYLYRVKRSSLMAIDTLRFTKYGYFAFPQKLNGSYLLRAELTKGSANYSHYFPSYYSMNLTWKSGEIINLTDSNSYHSNIHLIPTVDTLKGTSAILGFVIDGDRNLLSIEKPFAEVLLFNNQMKPQTFTFTDYTGHFEFPDLPPGTYNLLVEVPGFYSRVTTITLDIEHPIADSVVLEVFNHDVTGVEDHQLAQTIKVSTLYPNPVNEKIWFEVLSQKNVSLVIDILNITGQIRYTKSIEVGIGEIPVSIQVNSLSNGFYFLLIHSGDGTLINSQKFLKY